MPNAPIDPDADRCKAISLRCKLTPKQLDVLKLIVAYMRVNGVSPTLQEIADELGVSRVSVHEQFAALKEKGAIKFRKYRARSVKVVDQ